MEQAYKATVEQTLLEARRGLITTSLFMPNTSPPIIDFKVLGKYFGLIGLAEAASGKWYQQYIYFGATDGNFSECRQALKLPGVIGIKVYPKGKSGKMVTTGSIGVAKDITILKLFNLSENAGKPVAFHCDDPEIIANEGNTIRAESVYVEKILTMALDFPRAKIVICHVSCIESAMLVLKAQKMGMHVALELCPHYLWFDSDGTNWNSALDPVFYHCYNKLRPLQNRLFLSGLLASNQLVIIGSDNAPHTREEKLEKKMGGLPSNQELVPVILTLARKLRISNQQVVRLLYLNAAQFFGISVASELLPYKLEKRVVEATYNNGKIVNPWAGSELYFPVPIE